MEDNIHLRSAPGNTIAARNVREGRHSRSVSNSTASQHAKKQPEYSKILMNKKLLRSSAAIPPGIDACHLLGRTADDYYILTDGTSFFRVDIGKADKHISQKRLEWFEASVTEYQKSLVPKGTGHENADEEPEKSLSKFVTATWVLPLACSNCSEVSSATIEIAHAGQLIS